jgi:transposase-like protein
LNINVSHVAIYKWIIKLSSVISLFEFENVFKVHGDETVIVFRDKKYYVWLLVEHGTNLIVAWHVSRYRDMSQVKILLDKYFSQRKQNTQIELITDGLKAYEIAVKLNFDNVEHREVRLGKNNECESKFSLFKMFVRAKRSFKKFSNIRYYVNGFCVVRNLCKLYENENEMITALASIIITS